MQEFDERSDMCPHCGYLINSLPSVAYHLYPGTLLRNRFVVGTVLGYSDLAVTYHAWDNTLEAHVAVKEFFPQGLVNRIPGTTALSVLPGDKTTQYQTGLRRFLDEAQSIANFGEHPNIIHVSAFFEENNTAYTVMEYLDGATLEERLKEGKGILSVQEAIGITTAICDALTELHKKGILHRDIDPANIRLCGNGAKLVDFSAARLGDPANERTRSAVITPGYAPPELYPGKGKQGAWTDTYALCATLYRMLTGQRPLGSIDRLAEDKLEMPTVYNPRIPDWLESVIMNGMALDHELRYKSAESLKTALLSQTQPELPAERSRKRQTQRLLLLIGAGVASLAVVTGAVSCLSSARIPSIQEGTELNIEVPAGMAGYYEKLYNDYFSAAYPEESTKLTLHFGEHFAEPAVYAYGTHAELPAMPAMTFFADAVSVEQYYLLRDFYRQHPGTPVIPTGYYEVMTYISGAGAQEQGFEIPEQITAEVLAEPFCKAPTCLAGLRDRVPPVTDLLQAPEYLPAGEAAERFALRQVNVMIGTNAEQSTILNVCQAHNNDNTTISLNYAIVPLTIGDRAQGFWADGWCIADGLEDSEREAAELWVRFLLTDGIQEAMYVSGSGSLTGIPLNKTAFGEYVSYKAGMCRHLEDSVRNMEICFMEENAT